jgi:uncharacterized membrane protein
MSTSDRLLLILHLGFAIFTLGPLTAATSVTPRYIRKRDAVVVRYLNRNTRIYGLGTLGVFLFGLFLGQDELAQTWLVISMTLFVVALVLLLLVERDQRKAAHLLEVAAAKAVPAKKPAEGEGEAKPEKETSASSDGSAGEDIAQVERGRIAAISGVVALIWVIILVLMVWNGS